MLTSSANKESSISFLPIHTVLIYFTFFISLARTSRTILNMNILLLILKGHVSMNEEGNVLSKSSLFAWLGVTLPLVRVSEPGLRAIV